MKIRRKTLAVICCTALCILFGCAGASGETAEVADDAAGVSGSNVGAGLSIVTTIFPPYDFAKAVAGEYAQVTQLLPAGAESHTFEPTPRDIITIQNCDLFIYAGGESDTWIEELLDAVDTKQVRFLSMMDCVETVEEEMVEGMQEEVEDAKESELDEHVWTAPSNAVLITEKIAEALSEIDSVHKKEYETNAAVSIKKLKGLDEAYRQVIENSEKNTMIVGDRFPFRYLADAYGLSYYAAFPGCSEDAEPSAATLAFLINKVKDEQIPVVFYIEFSNEKVADSICESAGAKKLLLHSCHNVSGEDLASGITYVDLMEQNLENLKEALQ